MENIIQQIVRDMVKSCIEYFDTNGLGELDVMAERLKDISCEAAKEMLAAFISFADGAIKGAVHERFMDGIKIRQSRVPRELVTALGHFRYERTYFDTPSGREYILDKILKVRAYDRVDAGVSARLASEATTFSFANSAKSAGGGLVSRQTVKNKTSRVGSVAYIPLRKAETPEVLHIFADEDHVHMQDGKSVILPLVTVCSGKREIYEGRNELIDAMHIQGFDLKPEELWERVYAVCAEKYDMALVKNIFLYGDGAAWIETGIDFFPHAVRVLDGFHLKSRLKRLFVGEAGAGLSLRARTALQRNDKAKFAETVAWIEKATFWLMPEGKEREARLKAISENAAYILSHWNAIQNIKREGAIGSCTEAMISHVLSERFSRNPMGWSYAGLKKMAMLRVYVKNGGTIKASDIAISGATMKTNVADKYESIVRRQQEEALRGAKDWSIFESENLISPKRTGTRVALDALGKRRKAI